MKRAYSLFEIKGIEEDAGIIEGIASTPSTDRMGDIVEPKGAQFKLPLPLLWQHNSREPIGHVIAANVTDAGIAIKAKIMKGVLPEIDRAWALIKSGLVRGLSIGFQPIESADIKGTWGQHFTKWDWLELSAVTIPANAEASIQTVKSIDEEFLRAASGNVQKTIRMTDPPGASGTKAVSPPTTKGTQMKIKEQIAGFEAKRAATVAAMAALLEKAESTLDASQQEQYDTMDVEVKQIDTHLTRLKGMLALMGETATPATEDKSDKGTPTTPKEDKSVIIRPGDAQMKPQETRKGMNFTRFCAALALAKGNVSQAAEIAVKWKDSSPEVLNVLKYAGQRGGTLGLAEDTMKVKTAVAAGDTTTTAWAGALVQYDNMASEFVEYLRPQTIIGKLQGLRRVPFNIRFPSQSSGSSVGWVGQGSPKKVSKLQLATNTLGFAKAAGIVVITKELAMFSSPSAETLVRDDLAASMVAFLDQQFIDPGVAASANVSPASITNGLTSQNQATGSTLATFEVDVAAAMSVLIAGEIPFTSAVWITDPYTAMKIGMLRDASGDYAYPGVGVNGGTLFGIPLITSNSVPHSVSAGSILVLAATPEIFLADEGGLEVDASDQASIEMNDAPSGGATSLTSLWQNNLIGIRCERVINWQRRRTAAVTYIDNLHL